ncbi:MAG TPA: hypothetical protein VH682_31155 [Gemmataceae bacterium]
MSRCCRCLLVVLASIASLAASYRTTNFVVEASDEKIAKKVGDSAERYRKESAVQWLGEEMPPWGRRCPIRVTITSTNSSGATCFAFDGGKVLSMDMHIEGTADRLISSVLPHEITHTVLAHHFRAPVPRWADEGAAVLSEDARERVRMEMCIRQLLASSQRFVPLRRLFSLRDYPRDVMALFAEGYSVSRFLIESHDRKTFLAFVGDGMKSDWDKACQRHYSYKNVGELETAWQKWVSAKNANREEEISKVRIEALETKIKLLKLENQLLKLQLTRARQAAKWKEEQDRLEAEIHRTRETLKELRRDTEIVPAAP